MSYEQEVKNHYRQQVKLAGLSPESTMPDHIVREKEVDAILSTLSAINNKELKILEIGCGNGALLDILFKNGYLNCTGVDYLEEFVGLAKSRNLPYPIEVGDIRKLSFADSSFDIVISERVIINLKDRDDQKYAFKEIRRVLKYDGYLIMFEAHEKSLDNLNEARSEFGLEPILMATQNRWFKLGELNENIKDCFEIVEEINGVTLTPNNLLSSHYYTSRVLHPLLCSLLNKNQLNLRNSHFSKFLGSILPPHGDYSPVQYTCLKCK